MIRRIGLKLHLPEWLLEWRLIVMIVVMITVVTLMGVALLTLDAQYERLEDAKQRVETQRILKPIVEGLQKRIETFNVFFNVPVDPMPDSLEKLLEMMRAHAMEEGLQDAEFLPDPRSLETGTIVTVTARLTGQTEAMRTFLVHLSNQKWIVSTRAVSVHVKGTVRTMVLQFTARHRGDGSPNGGGARLDD
ncbi:MAG: hypothetical protein ACI4SV_03975 [Duodenibacillus sp.]